MTRPAVLLLILASVGLASLSATSCFVSRRSQDFACITNSDCDSSRRCDQGYCVPRSADCPEACTSCDVGAATCEIDCVGRQCGDLRCPAGYSCTINCDGGSACGDIACDAGKACDITCLGTGACGNIRCGALEKCTVTCTAAQACGTIDCLASCSCDTTCLPTTACGSTTCPLSRQGNPCTDGGMAGASCDSTQSATCDTCL